MISLRNKLSIGFGALLLIVLLVSLLSYIVMTRYSRALERMLRENYDSAVYCDHMKAAVDRLNLRALMLMWNPTQADQIDSAAEKRDFDFNLDYEFHNITLAGEGAHTQHLSDVWQQYKEAMSKFDADAPGERKALYESTLLPLFNDIHQTAQWISDANMSNLVSVDGKVKQTLVEVRNALLALTLAGIVAAALIVGAAGTAIFRPLGHLTRSARQIESGNLDLNLPVEAHDEVGILSDAFNSMARKLREFRRLDADRLVRTQQTTQLAIDSLPDAVFIVGPDEKIEISNRTAREHFGIEPNLTVSALVPRLKWLGPLYDSVHEGREQPQTPGYLSAIQFFDHGAERFLLPRAVPMLDRENKQIGVAFILVDVTRLRAADEAKGSIVSTISHELRTPLTSMRMAISLLNGNKFGPLTEKQRSIVSAAAVDSDRLYRIIENLLSISRMESGRVDFQFRPVPPAEILSQSVEALRSAFTEKSIQLNVSNATDLPPVQADSSVIGLVLTNLLSNALKFTPSGGKVSVSAEANGRFVIFSVEDTGPGIPKEFRSRIFDKFFRIPQKDGPTGAGLGLSIAKEVVEAHGGTIELCKDLPQGSKFRFTLPQAVPTPAN
jgi:NtrC-family two-component system sensor histidine kinase KinB